MKKRILIITLLLTIIIGCSSPKKDDSKYTIRVVMKDVTPSNPDSIAYFDYIKAGVKKEFNHDVEFELVELPQGNYSEKLNLMLMSNDIPDLIYFQGGDLEIANQGVLEDLNPYLDKAQYLNDHLYEHNKARLKNYPYLLYARPLATKVPVISKNLFDSLPSKDAFILDPSIDNYYQLLSEAKQALGESSYAITIASNLDEIDNIFNMAFGNTSTWVLQDGKYVYSKITNSEKEKLKFYHKLYENKLLDPNFMNTNWETKENAFYKKEVAIISGGSGAVVNVYNNKMMAATNEELIVLPPAKGIAQGYGASDITKEQRGFAISSSAKDKQVVFDVLDYMASPDGQMLDLYGLQDKHYQVEDEKLKLTKDHIMHYPLFWEIDNFIPMYDYYDSIYSNASIESKKISQSFYQEDINIILDESIITKWDSINNLYNEFSIDVITGAKSIDEFDNYVKEFYKLGGQELEDYANQKINKNN
ncbi:MAG: extracellular solute-binding protein [Bacilli bacterium]